MTQSKENVLLNGLIKAKEIQLINEFGENVGVINKFEALNMAEEIGLDLVQVSEGEIPVCKLLDYKKSLYESKKKSRGTKESKVKWKEIQMNINIGENDIKVKASSTNKMLAKGHKIKAFVMLKGREIEHPELAHKVVEKFLSFVSEGEVTKAPHLEGNRLVFHIE